MTQISPSVVVSRKENPEAGRPRMLLDEDDRALTGGQIVITAAGNLDEMLCDFLVQHGFDAWSVEASGLDQVLPQAADLAILDLDSLGEKALSVCRRLASAQLGVILLSSANRAEDKIAGLEAGADDYLGKPCNLREVVARTRAILRRHRARSRDTPRYHRRFAGWRLDMLQRLLLSPANELVHLSDAEFNLLCGLLDQPHRVFSRAQLLTLRAGAGPMASDKGIDVQVSRLRRKLQDRNSERLIRTVRNEGYMLTVDVTG